MEGGTTRGSSDQISTGRKSKGLVGKYKAAAVQERNSVVEKLGFWMRRNVSMICRWISGVRGEHKGQKLKSTPPYRWGGRVLGLWLGFELRYPPTTKGEPFIDEQATYNSDN